MSEISTEDTVSNVVASILLAICITCFAIVGVLHSLRDYRHFSAIVQECKENGRIQNKTTRVICSVEER